MVLRVSSVVPAALLLAVMASTAAAQPITGDSPMLQMLDAMQQLMTGGQYFDREYYAKLRDCMDTFDDRLGPSQDAAWQGIIDYWLMGGAKSDPWGSDASNYLEQNATQTDFLNMTIYEPCNYASNVAYYHDMTEFCARRAQGKHFVMPEEYVNGLGKAYAFMAMGSSFMHMSHTKLGAQLDTRGISVVSYLLQQSIFSMFKNVSHVLTDLSLQPRSKSALAIAEDFLDMYLYLPVTEWQDRVDSLDIPNYFLTFAGLSSTALTLSFKPEVVDKYFLLISEHFGLPEDIHTFIVKDYLPELRNLIGDVRLGLEHFKFLKNAASTGGKLIYAFLWQEEFFTNNTMFLDESINMLGWDKLPVVNTKLNDFNTFEYFDPDFQNGTRIYPGDDWCNPVMPHAKWHLESGIGLLDLTYLGDEVYRILLKTSNGPILPRQ